MALKALDTFGNCQRPLFLHAVSQHMHKNNTTVNIWAQLVIEVAREKKETGPFFAQICEIPDYLNKY